MRDLTLSQEYLLCAVNEKGRLPHLGVERTVCLVAAALLELQLEGCVAVDKKYVTVTAPLNNRRIALWFPNNQNRISFFVFHPPFPDITFNRLI